MCHHIVPVYIRIYIYQQFGNKLVENKSMNIPMYKQFPNTPHYILQYSSVIRRMFCFCSSHYIPDFLKTRSVQKLNPIAYLFFIM